MLQEGAVGFSDNENSIQNAQFLRYALEYSNMHNKVPIINYSRDITMSPEGVVNEGIVSTKLGLSGIPNICESTIVFRDLMIAKQAKSKIHIPLVSTKESINIISVNK